VYQTQLRKEILSRFNLRDPRDLPGLHPAVRRAAGLSPSAASRLPSRAAPASLLMPVPHALSVAKAVAPFTPPAPAPAPDAIPEPLHAIPARVPPLPRLLPVPPARTLITRRAVDPGLARAVEGMLLVGGLWRVEDLAGNCGARPSAVGDALSGLSREGGAVLVALGHWRSRRRDACLLQQGRTAPARMLGGLLHGLTLDLPYVADLLGLEADDVSTAAPVLVRNALAVEVRPGRYRCPDPVRAGIIERLGPSPLTDLGRRLVDALCLGGPMRKAEAADAIGIGRGSANRMIDRLVEEGWLRQEGGDRYLVA
jgi:hypothetical protein